MSKSNNEINYGDYQAIIEAAYAQRAAGSSISQTVREAVAAVMHGLDQGSLRVAEQIEGQWQVHAWVKQAVLLSFLCQEKGLMQSGVHQYYDKVPLKFTNYQEKDFQRAMMRVVPGAVVRHSAYIGKDVVLMPSFINVAAYVGPGTMIDTWATVGSCAQIGARVHISGGAGIGGVLEPLQAAPTIIEDDCFIGARAEIVEGVVVERGAVIAMGTYIGQSTKIVDAATGQIHFGRIPADSVVVPGSLPAKQGHCHLACAVIVKRVDQRTRQKIGINALLREAMAEQTV